MKKLLLVSVVVLFAVSINAQVQFGIKAGMNIASQKLTAGGISISPKSLIGFHAGVILDMAMGETFAIQPGFLFSQKGAKYDSDGETGTDTYNYLDIPINVVYKINTGSAKILLNVGPLFSYALSEKSEGSEDATFGSGDGELKRLDFGIGFGGGVQFGSVVASLNYNLGLANIMNVPSGADVSLKNNVFGISIAYFFGGK